MLSKFRCFQISICFFLTIQLMIAAEPPTSVKLTIPDYVVTKRGDIDEVVIPDGYVLEAEDGRPQVPYFIKKVDYPAGYRIQDVVMKERSGKKTDSDLTLPLVMPTRESDKVQIKKEPYPQEDFNWSALYDHDGTATLVISIYPFYYDPKTKDVEFYTEYEFGVSYVHTGVTINRIMMGKPVYDPGDKVSVDVQLANSGKSQDVSVAASVYFVYNTESEADIPAKTVQRLGKTGSVSLEWKTAGFPAGDYEIEVIVTDLPGNELDRERTTFRVGTIAGEVKALTATPQNFKIGDDVEFALDFQNNGTSDLTGEYVFRIMRSGEIVDELRQDMGTLDPGASTTFREKWNTDEAEKGAIYYVVGFVRYAGTASEPKSTVFSTNQFPNAKFSYTPEEPIVKQEISYDASMSADPDGSVVQYAWNFGDGGKTEGVEAIHHYSLPGEYTVTLIVTDNEGATGKIAETLVIGE